MTLYGENLIIRIPDDEEIFAVSKELDKHNYEPSYIKKLKISNYSEHLKRVFKNMLRFIFFNFKLLNPRDKYDYHYLASSKGILRYSSIY